jgi:uncharacterized C2H2 Zn-finger protein
VEVITHGKFGARRHRCAGCECVFEYTTDDIHHVGTDDYEGTDDGRELFVLCPECGRPVASVWRKR